LRRKDGSEIDGHIRIKHLDPSDPDKGTISAIADISDRKRSEEELRRSEERLELALKGADLGLWDWNLKSGRAVWDERSLAMLGYKPGEIEPNLRAVKDSVHSEDWPKLAEALKANLEGRLSTFDLACRFRSESGEWRWILSQGKIVAYGPDGKPWRMAGTSLDITERKQAEQERESLRAQLVQAQKMEAIGTLTGGIAHEFNNLLTVVLGYTELLLAEKNESDAGYEDLEKIGYAAHRGAELVRDLLAFSRKSEMNPAPVNLNREVEHVKKLLDRTLSRTIEIDLNLSDELKAVKADSGQIRQVLINLALNASDAMPHGGTLTIDTANTSQEGCAGPTGAMPDDCVLVTVSDTGIGMDQEVVKRIFEPFYSAKGLAYKTGLGLAVVHGIIEQHGGRITCDSLPGQGTTFRVCLPAMEATASHAIPGQLQDMRGTETILVVDDEEYVRDLASRILSRAGYRVITAEDGRQAVDVYAKEKSNISLVILDLIMPKVGGKQCLDKLLKIHPGSNVLIASGHSDGKNREELLRAGAKGFVGKPFRIAQLLKTVRQILDEN
jgi:two-component system cell cycle sensor histidine kinase/response regulator CckA